MFELQLHVRVGAHATALYHVPQDARIVVVLAAGPAHILPQNHRILHIRLQRPAHVHAPVEFQ